MAATLLLGPPELYKKFQITIPNLFKPILTLQSTKNPCLDFFFQILPNTPQDLVIKHLELAWKHDPLTTLKLICNLRGVKGTGKGDKESFYVASIWLLKNHPKTLTLNMDLLVRFGYLKDLVEITVRYSKNSSFNVHVTNLFSRLLIADTGFLKLKLFKKISLASKWCPSIDDTASLSLFDSIAKQVCSPGLGIEEAREYLQNQVPDPLREALQMPEVYMNSNRWKELPYHRVASVAMNTYNGLFMKHDKARFMEYLKKVSVGDMMIPGGALLPHEILESIVDDEKNGKVAELQWKSMVKELSQHGKLKDCLAILDVSESMEGTALQVCIAMGLLISDLSEEPWKWKLITFSKNSKIHNLEGKTMEERRKIILDQMSSGKGKNLKKVFELMLAVASAGNLKHKKMIKRVFVLSDMDFDEKEVHSFDDSKRQTYYQSIRKVFSDNGFGWAVPEMVFWKVRNSLNVPVVKTEKGVALVSGYSKNLLKLFVKGGKVDTPESVMKAAICEEEYQSLTVYD